MSAVLNAPATIPAPTRTTGGRVTWIHVESGFHVASCAGEYVGFAERTPDGHFVGFDARSTPVGRYADLGEAKDAVVSARRHAMTESKSPRVQAALHTAAAATGLVALGTLATAVATLPGF